MNQHNSQQIETTTDEPVPPQAVSEAPALHRALAVAVPAFGGAMLMVGAESGISGNRIAAVLSFALGAVMLVLAWTWTTAPIGNGSSRNH